MLTALNIKQKKLIFIAVIRASAFAVANLHPCAVSALADLSSIIPFVHKQI